MGSIRWTDGAEESYLNLLDTLSRQSIEAAILLQEQIDKMLHRLQRFQHICPPIEGASGLRRCRVTRYITLVYTILDQDIVVLSVFDSRMDTPFA